MKRLLSLIFLVFVFFAVMLTPPALAGDAAAGKTVFTAKCAQCHLGGKNLVNPAKTLSKADLEANGMASLDAIITQVTNGKAAMPAFGKLLTAEQIENVATYVLAQAEADWK
ncbi:cytochrome c class I [Rippkaea orientalis PCC 8801]|uniref:Cytochrome c6 n=1 Tax=Rippkaea orientalis (strain PCC 8801 / RF-1) TaxID=41431 RepID=CYC6_RIPO1|nr:c-type cytochrome [Rippkaea orientalis]B7JYX3.1 RecName: Full=Cytochrome c6; AltName: Full=Cytochrome c-553; AltName: Full=Cytochrome c553; AltName: Full=Soluble cytochrome f; Flags: Precursor [Rippkaea orientalis PCC 8801]ACK66050.1 cytochrome c class I [Rippkaea orientalis PCC 8801]